MKIESKISDLGTKINILCREMTEQMTFEVDVKKMIIFESALFALNALGN